MRFDTPTLPSWIHRFQPSFFDPLYVCAQIVALQSAFYLSFAFLLVLWISLFKSSSSSISTAGVIATAGDSISEAHISLDYLFDPARYTWARNGRAMVILFWINAGIGCYWLLWLVQKTKHVLDFTVTLHALHFLATCVTARTVPSHFLWYLSISGSMCIMVLAGEHMCMRRETSPIPLTAASLSTNIPLMPPRTGPASEAAAENTNSTTPNFSSLNFPQRRNSLLDKAAERFNGTATGAAAGFRLLPLAAAATRKAAAAMAAAVGGGGGGGFRSDRT